MRMVVEARRAKVIMSTESSPLRVIPLGVGDFFSRVNFTTTLLVLGGHTCLLIDCPEPVRKVLYESTTAAGEVVDAFDIDAVLLTHLHGDHSNGLEGFAFYRKQKKGSPGRPPLYALPENLESLWEHKLKAAMGRSYLPEKGIDSTSSLDTYFEPHPIQPGVPFQIGDFAIEVQRTRHPVPCVGCKVRYNGRTFGYSSDTDFDPQLIAFLEEADLIFHECNEGVHTTYDELSLLPEPMRRKMRLVHLSDDFDRQQSLIEPAAAGKVYLV